MEGHHSGFIGFGIGDSGSSLIPARARYGLGRGGDWGLAVCMCMPHPACGRARMGHGCVWAERVGRGQAESSRGARANEQPFVPKRKPSGAIANRTQVLTQGRRT